MSYRTELQRRKEANEETAAQEARRQREATVQRENRADELHGHIEANSTGVGVVLTQEGTRLILQHNNSKDTVYIDADVNTYNLMKVRSSPGNPAPSIVANSQRVAESVHDVDQYIIDFLDSIDALNRRE